MLQARKEARSGRGVSAVKTLTVPGAEFRYCLLRGSFLLAPG
jgi:hypothetical protein